jgi:hypothetical protein
MRLQSPSRTSTAELDRHSLNHRHCESRRDTVPAIKWTNDRVDTAPTWEALEDLVRNDQWSPYSPDEFRVEMQRRAGVWSGNEITTVGDSKAFFEELRRAGLIEIVSESDC